MQRGSTLTQLSPLLHGVVPLSYFSLLPNLPSSTSAAFPAHSQVFLFLLCPFGPLLFNGLVLRNHGYQWIQWSLPRHIFHNHIVWPALLTDCLPEAVCFSSHGILPDNQGDWKPEDDKSPRTDRTQIYRDKYTKYDIGFVNWKVMKL